MSIQQICDIDIQTIRALGGGVQDQDHNGILSVGDAVNRIRVEASDLSSNEAKSEFLSQVLRRRIDILGSHAGQFILFASSEGRSDDLELVYRLTHWGHCAGKQGAPEYECISEDAKYDPDYDHGDPYKDMTRDVLFYSAQDFINPEARLSQTLAKITDKETREHVEFYLNDPRGFLPDRLHLKKNPPAGWTKADDALIARVIYARKYEQLEKLWRARQLGLNDVANLQFLYGQYALYTR